MTDDLSQTTLAADTPVEPESRRDMLAAALTDAEQPEQVSAEQRARDEGGRFAPKANEPPPAPAPVEAKAPRLTTWKKEYLPLADKLAQGIPLTPEEAKKLDAYNVQRESEYSTGVSVHKERATRLEGIEKAIAPFMPDLQQYGITPDKWIQGLGSAHQLLSKGTPEQKLQAFQKLAKDYNIPLGGVPQQGQGIDPAYAGLMEQIQQLQGQVQSVTGWKEQQDQKSITSAIEEFAADTEKHPHFEKVRGTMSELLLSGMAPDLKTAYAKAIRMDDDVWNEEQARLTQASAAQNTTRQVVARARNAAVSPRSATPSGAGAGSSTQKDRRALIAEGLDAANGRV